MFAYLDMGHVFLLISGTIYLLVCRCFNSSPFKTADSGPVVACLRGGSASNVSIPGGIRKEKHNYAI